MNATRKSRRAGSREEVLMRIFIFESGVDARLRALAGDLDGSKLSVQFRPWPAFGSIAPDRSSVSASARANRRSHSMNKLSALAHQKRGRKPHRDSRGVASGLLFNNFVATRVELSKYGPNQMFSVHIRHQHLRSIGTLSGFREINVRILNGAKHNTEDLGFDHAILLRSLRTTHNRYHSRMD
jgi:hypothetical protein